MLPSSSNSLDQVHAARQQPQFDQLAAKHTVPTP